MIRDEAFKPDIQTRHRLAALFDLGIRQFTSGHHVPPCLFTEIALMMPSIGRCKLVRTLPIDWSRNLLPMIRAPSPALGEAVVKRYYYPLHAQLKEHIVSFLNAYNFAKHLKSLQGLTPYEYIIKCWQKEPERFILNPIQHKVGLNISIGSSRSL